MYKRYSPSDDGLPMSGPAGVPGQKERNARTLCRDTLAGPRKNWSAAVGRRVDLIKPQLVQNSTSEIPRRTHTCTCTHKH